MMAMKKTVLWIDDSADERAAGEVLLRQIDGIDPKVATSSNEARLVMENNSIDAVITDILRRRSGRSVSDDDGYNFFVDYIRPHFPSMPVIFHTKNLPHTSSRFTKEAELFRKTVRQRPLLRDGEWLKTTLQEYAPGIRRDVGSN